jgi:hypothetical protein
VILVNLAKMLVLVLIIFLLHMATSVNVYLDSKAPTVKLIFDHVNPTLVGIMVRLSDSL